MDIQRVASFRALRELASQLGAATGPDTFAVLQRLAALGRNDVEPFLSRALSLTAPEPFDSELLVPFARDERPRSSSS